MYTLYLIVSKESEKFYIGITSKKLNLRFNEHKSCARLGRKTPLYSWMRKYDTQIRKVDSFETRQECNAAEKHYIAQARLLNQSILNLAEGGEGGFVIQDTEAWKAKLREARKGRKPFQGKKHSKETKQLCAEASKLRWKRTRSNEPC